MLVIRTFVVWVKHGEMMAVTQNYKTLMWRTMKESFCYINAFEFEFCVHIPTGSLMMLLRWSLQRTARNTR